MSVCFSKFTDGVYKAVFHQNMYEISRNVFNEWEVKENGFLLTIRGSLASGFNFVEKESSKIGYINSLSSM